MKRTRRAKLLVQIPVGEFSLAYSPAGKADAPLTREQELRKALRAARKRAYYWSNFHRGYSPRSNRDVRTNHSMAMAEVRRLCVAIHSLTGKRPRCSDPAPKELSQDRLAIHS